MQKAKFHWPFIMSQLNLKKRKGAVRRADVPPDILKKLNRGEIEALTLAEVLSVDFAQLLKHGLPNLNPASVAAMKAEAETGWVGRTKRAGQIILDDLGLDALPHMLAHVSDQVRGWGASLVAAAPKLTLKKRLTLIKPLADDPNAGVREVAWIMLRPHVAEDIEHSIDILLPWTKSDSANIRRYASEITRPRGVWCAYLPALQKKPEMALDILEPLKSDPSRYVQNSVANWLNDASKGRADFVMKVTKRWEKESRSKETAYIVKRARRTLLKKD
jgi:3-methyladenine DNA glycosylase AlkC